MSRILLTELNSNVRLSDAVGNTFRFHIDRCIGTGASCVVYHAIREDNTEHLLKEYYPKRLDLQRNRDGTIVVPEKYASAFRAGLEQFAAACERQKSIRLSNYDLKNATCNVQGYYRGNGTEYIDMTCFAGRTYDEVQEKSVYDLMRRMKTLAQVIGNYHKAGLLHLDIKPDNIYVRPETETVEDVMLFDFDSVTEIDTVATSPTLSYTKTWAAPEQKLPRRYRDICPATDLFVVGEIIFYQIYGRHSTDDERFSFAQHTFDCSTDIFKNMNPRVFPLLNELLRHTICNPVQQRYQSADELAAALDEIIKLADPKEPYIKKVLPAVQNFFIGRDKELKEIHLLLQENDILFLNGIGGIGKSELAKQYAHRYQDSYDAIAFAPYVSDTDMLIQDDSAIQINNFSPYPEEKPKDYCARKLRKLRELCNQRTLIIIDNLDNMEDGNIPKLFDLGCKLLITTRADFSEYGFGCRYDLDALSSREKITEIFERYYTKPLSKTDSTLVSEIIDIVGGHTLTVELLAKQMIAGRVTPKRMLTKLKEGGLEASGKEKVRSGKDGHLSAQNTYAHLQTLFDLSGLNEQEKDILTNLSLIPYTGVSAELFCSWCELEDFDAINDLVAEGWIYEDKRRDYFSVHPVISQIVLRKSLDTGSVEAFLHQAISYVDACQINDERAVLSQMMVYAADTLIRRNILSKYILDFSSMALFIGMPLLSPGKMSETGEKLLSACRKLPGIETVELAGAYLSVAQIYTSLGDTKKVEDHCRNALDIVGKEYNGPETAYAYFLLGQIKLMQNGLPEAYGYLGKALNLFQCAKEPVFAVSVCFMLNMMSILNGDTKDADLYNAKAKTIISDLPDDDAAVLYDSFELLNTAANDEWQGLQEADTFYNDLLAKAGGFTGISGSVYFQLGRLHLKHESFDDAAHYLTKCIEIKSNPSGKQSIEVAIAYQYLGDVYSKQGFIEKAEDHYLRSLHIFQDLGEGLEFYLEFLCNKLGVIYQKKKDFEEAKNYLLRSHQYRISLYGEESSDVGFSYIRLGNLCIKQENLAASAEYLRKGIDILEQMGDAQKVRLGNAYSSLGFVYDKCGDTENAKQLYRKALEVRCALFPENHQKVVYLRQRLELLSGHPQMDF